MWQFYSVGAIVTLFSNNNFHQLTRGNPTVRYQMRGHSLNRTLHFAESISPLLRRGKKTKKNRGKCEMKIVAK